MAEVPMRAPQSDDKAGHHLGLARQAELAWGATDPLTRQADEQAAQQADAHYNTLTRRAQAQFLALLPISSPEDLGRIPADFPAYHKRKQHPARFLEDFVNAATRTSKRQPAEPYHFLWMLAVVPDQSLRAYVDQHIVKAGLDWRAGKQVFLRREMEPAAHVVLALRPLKMRPVTTPGSADSVESFAQRWIPEIEALQVNRDSLLVKLLFAMQLQHMKADLTKIEPAVFDSSVSFEQMVSEIKGLRFAVPPNVEDRAKPSSTPQRPSAPAPTKDNLNKGCEYCQKLGKTFWWKHQKDKCFLLHPELRPSREPTVLLQQFQELEQEVLAKNNPEPSVLTGALVTGNTTRLQAVKRRAAEELEKKYAKFRKGTFQCKVLNCMLLGLDVLSKLGIGLTGLIEDLAVETEVEADQDVELLIPEEAGPLCDIPSAIDQEVAR
ncbi:hypothetical protein RI367_001635 [Sorochytrium milnesiophthora]